MDNNTQEKNLNLINETLNEGENLYDNGSIIQATKEHGEKTIRSTEHKRNIIDEQNKTNDKGTSDGTLQVDKDNVKSLKLSNQIKKCFITTTVFWSIVIALTILVVSGAIFDVAILYSNYFTTPLYILLPISMILQSRYTYLRKQGSKLSLKNKGFNFNKEHIIGNYTFMIDENNKSWCIMTKVSLSKVYKFSDIISYEIYEDEKSVVKGSAGKALIGGVFFGTIGAIVGSSGKRKVNNYCTSLKLLIRINDIQTPLIELVILNSQTDKQGSFYKNSLKGLQEISASIEYILNNKIMENQTSKNPDISTNKRQQLLELKELLQEGLITEDDYNKKKDDILK